MENIDIQNQDTTSPLSNDNTKQQPKTMNIHDTIDSTTPLMVDELKSN